MTQPTRVPERAAPPEGQPLHRRARNRNARRDRVFQAAVELFTDQGFEQTSMEEIAARAGLARGTVFNHFPRKVSFLEEWTQRRRERAARSFADEPSETLTVREKLARYLTGLATLNEQTRTETTAIMPPTVLLTGTLLDHPLGRDLGAILAEAPERIRPGVDPELIGRLLALGYFSAVCRWIEVDPAPFDLGAELATLLSTVLDGGLLPPPDVS